MGSKTDIAVLQRALGAALELQYRSALSLAVAAGAVRGPFVALSATLRDFAAAELGDVEALAARLVMIGGDPPTRVAGRATAPSSQGLIRRLVEEEREAIDALVEAIPADADDAEGEATEHLLEHVIHRKRQQLELLERALAEPATRRGRR